LIEFPLRQKKSVSFIFRCALIFVDTYAHTLFLKSISFFKPDHPPQVQELYPQ
jgi:hypothetical protein